MNEEKDVVNIIYKISQLVREINDEDFQHLEEIVEEQDSYYNPLKMETTRNQHELAEHNMKMINTLKTLKELVSKED